MHSELRKQLALKSSDNNFDYSAKTEKRKLILQGMGIV